MASRVMMRHPSSGIVKPGFYGFSWTSFFFGGFPALIRGDFAYGFGILAAGLVLGLFSFGLLGILVNVIWAAMYNKNYTHRMLQSGFQFDDSDMNMSAARSALGIVNPGPTQ